MAADQEPQIAQCGREQAPMFPPPGERTEQQREDWRRMSRLVLLGKEMLETSRTKDFDEVTAYMAMITGVKVLE
jgi:hypothetical protein